MNSSRYKELVQMIGPGLLYAGAAIGVSHLVQSTRAGAEYGYALIWAVILANVLKYPFFQFGPRYATATGKSLMEGYKQLGNWALGLFILMTFGTMFTIQAAVTVVTAGLAEQLTGIDLEAWQWSGILLLTCLLILGIGHYKVLDKLMKAIIIILTITTVIALISSFSANVERSSDLIKAFSWSDKMSIFFLIALMGWMPAPIDISVWHSVWTLAKKREKSHMPSMKQSLFDFNLGYWGTALLALCFLTLGAQIMFGTGEELSSSGSVFAGQIINLYTTSIGPWAKWIIAIAAFTTMFSTTLTCLDAFPRVLRKATQLVIPSTPQDEGNHLLYWIWILITAAGALFLLAFLSNSMGWMVDVATILSFLTAPVLAIMNYFAITAKDVPEQYRPSKGMKVLSWAGIAFLVAFSIYFIIAYSRLS